MGRGTEAVVDSPVAIKWFSEEDKTDKALILMDQHVRGTRRLCVSDLLYHEVDNGLRYKPDYDEEKLNRAIGDLFGLHLNTWPVDRALLGKAATVAYRGDVTINDAIPVALAELRGTICITADEETQFKRLKARGYPVSLLSRIPD